MRLASITSWLRRKRRAFAIAGAVIAVLLTALILVLRMFFHGEALAQFVVEQLGETRGSVNIRSIEWSVADLRKVVTGGYMEVTVLDLEIIDKDGVQVVHTPKAHLEIDVQPAIGGKTFRIRNLRIHEGDVTIRMIEEPYPAHEYDDQVVSLVAAFYPTRRPSFSTGYSARRPPTIDILDFEIDGKGVNLEYVVDGLSAKVEAIRGGGYLYSGGNDPLGPKLYFSLAANDLPKTRAEGATITTAEEVIHLKDIEVLALGQLPSRWPAELIPRDIVYHLRAKGEEGMQVDIKGALLDAWIDIFGGDNLMTVDIQKAGDIAETFSQGMAGGDNLHVTINMDGPVKASRFSADIRDLEVTFPMAEDKKPLVLQISKASPRWDMATKAGAMDGVVAGVKGAQGRLELQADFQVDPVKGSLDIDIPEAIELADYIPDPIRRVVQGTKLTGSLKAVGNQDEQRLDKLALQLGDAKISGVAFRDKEGRIHPDGVNVSLPGTGALNVRGYVDPSNETLELDFRLDAGNIARLLRIFGVNPMLRSLRGPVHVEGSFDNPIVRSRSLVAGGVPILDRVEANLEYAHSRLKIIDVEAASLGGWLHGSGTIDLSDAPRLQNVKAEGVNLQLAKLPLIGPYLRGELDLNLDGNGPVRRPTLMSALKLSNWSVADDEYEDTSITLNSDRGGTLSVEATLERKRGGLLYVHALADKFSQLTGALSLRDVPVDSLLAQTDNKLPRMGGDLSAEVQLGGSLESPTLDGEVSLLRSWFQEAFLGSASFSVNAVGNSEVHIVGSIFQERIKIDCMMTTAAPYRTELSLILNRIELDRFAPQFTREHNLRAWLSGTVTYKGSLDPKEKPRVIAKLTEAEVVIKNEDENGRPSPIRLRNRSDVNVSFDGEKLLLLNDATILGPTGDLRLAGSGTVDALDFKVEGTVDVQLLRPYLSRYFEDMSGQLLANAQIKGTASEPRVEGTISVENIKLRPAGQDAMVDIPAGRIQFDNSQLVVTGLRVEVKDEFTSDTAELIVGGGIGLDNFTPKAWAMTINGQLAGKMLLVVAPEVFSTAAGSADVSVALLGMGTEPDIDGTIEFHEADALTLTPRALRRELAFTGGTLRFTDQLVELEAVEGTIDGDGKLTSISGEISLEEWQPVDVDLTVFARDISYRKPDLIELSLNLENFRVVGGIEGLDISGLIDVVDGRFLQDFDPWNNLAISRTSESAPSVFETVPLLGNAKLDIALRSSSFVVDNNIANIDLAGDIEIAGTPLYPTFDGSITVAGGTFDFPGSRANFDRTSGLATFSPSAAFPAETPELNILSEADYTAPDGQAYQVQLTVTGTISKPLFALTTSSGLQTTQTIALIFAGQTPQDLQRSYLADNPASRPTSISNAQASTLSDNNLQIVDELTKDVAGDWFSLIFGDKLRKFTKLDLVRVQVGTGSVGMRGEKNLTRSLKLSGQWERTLNGWSLDGQVRLQISDVLGVDFRYLERNFDDEAETDDQQVQLRGSWRKYWIP